MRPAQAFFSKELGEFILPYDAVRTAPDPKQALLDFLGWSCHHGGSVPFEDREFLPIEVKVDFLHEAEVHETRAESGESAAGIERG